MKFRENLLATGAAIFLSAAAPYSTMYSLPSVAAFEADNFAQFETINLLGYYASGDGGQGQLKNQHSTSCSADQGLWLKDAAGHCFKRAPFRGTLAEYGVTTGSEFDCLGDVTGCQGAAVRLKSLISAANTEGVETVYGEGIQIKVASDGLGNTGAPFAIDVPVCLDMGINAQSLGDPLVDPGVIWTEGTTVLQLANDGCLQHAAVVIAHFAETWPAGALTIAEKYAVRQYVTDTGQTGVACTGGGCRVYDIVSAGYDNPLNVRGANTLVNYVHLDGNVNLYAWDKGDASKWNNFRFDAILVRGEGSTKYFSVDNVTCSGGKTRVKVRLITGGQAGAFSDITDGIHLWISGLTEDTGGANAWDSWDIDKISTDTFDLEGSVCSGAALDGPTLTTVAAASGSKLLTGAIDQTNIREGMIVTGSGNLAASTHVQALWPAQNIIVLDKATTGAISSGASIKFSGGALVTPTTDCEPGSGGEKAPCVALTAAVKYESGDSDAGIAADHHAAGLLCGKPYPGLPADITDYKVAGLQISNLSMYGIEVPFYLQTCETPVISDFKTDSIRKIKDEAAGCAFITGDVRKVIMADGGCGKVARGYGVLVDVPVDNDDQDIGAVILSNATVRLEVNQGKVVANGIGSGGEALIANEAKNTQLNGNFSHTNVIYEGAVAQSRTDTSGALVASGASWWGGHITPGGIAPSIVSGGGTNPSTPVGNDSVFRFNVGTSPGTTDIVIAFSGGWPNSPVCDFWDETTAAVSPKPKLVSVTGVTITNLTGLVAGDTISGKCTGWSN